MTVDSVIYATLKQFKNLAIVETTEFFTMVESLVILYASTIYIYGGS